MQPSDAPHVTRRPPDLRNVLPPERNVRTGRAGPPDRAHKQQSPRSRPHGSRPRWLVPGLVGGGLALVTFVGVAAATVQGRHDSQRREDPDIGSGPVVSVEPSAGDRPSVSGSSSREQRAEPTDVSATPRGPTTSAARPIAGVPAFEFVSVGGADGAIEYTVRIECSDGTMPVDPYMMTGIAHNNRTPLVLVGDGLHVFTLEIYPYGNGLDPASPEVFAEVGIPDFMAAGCGGPAS